MKAGARAYWLKAQLGKELLGTIRAALPVPMQQKRKRKTQESRLAVTENANTLTGCVV